jgi:hypothetical protein
MKKLLIALAVPIVSVLHAQDEKYYNGDTTGKVHMSIDASFKLTTFDSFLMHNLRSLEDYGVLLRGKVYKHDSEEVIYFCNYELVDLVVFLKNKDVIKKEEYFEDRVVTTEFLN